MSFIKSMYRKNLAYRWWFNSRITLKQNTALSKWRQLGMPMPPPHEYKQSLILNYSRKYSVSVFIETGTFLGYMVEVMKYRFKKLISIELDLTLYGNARKKFTHDTNITILQGDSTYVLPQVLSELHEPSLFWLDGHYSEGITAKGKLNTPIISELKSILEHPIKDHLILIDDARCFVGNNDYPTVEELKTLVLKNNSALNVSVENDVIIICKSIPSG